MMNNIMEEDGGYRRRRLSERQEPHQEKQRGHSYLDEITTSSSHSSDYGAPKLGHPTSYDDDPPFKGPLTLSRTVPDSSFDNNRVRIRHYYYDNQYDEQQRSLQLDGNNNGDNSSPLTTTKKIMLGLSTPTNVILKAIVDHLAYRDAPVDVKEVAESIEFYLRCGKRLLGAARRTTKTAILRDDDHDSIYDGSDDDNDDDHNDMRNDMFNNQQQNIINVQDLCSGHGLTGMIFLACNPPGRIIDIDGNSIMITATCIDIVEPKSHNVLRGIIAEICPWVGVDGAVSFITSSLEEYATAVIAARQEQQQQRRRHGATTMETVVISTHACGSLTDKVLHYASTINASSIAVMPCCYTGTADGAPYGIKRILGVSLAADIRRSFALQECGAYHVDFASIPKSITPMNRIIVAERRK
jgi:hypothetical protein